MSLKELQAELARLAREQVHGRIHRRQLAPQLSDLSRRSGRSLVLVRAMFETVCEDVMTGVA